MSFLASYCVKAPSEKSRFLLFGGIKMTPASDILSQAEIDMLRTMFRTRLLNPDQSIKGLYGPVYEALYDLLTSSAHPGVDEQTLLWLRGARQINADEGAFAILIRDYTAIQFRLRYGTDLPLGELDKASNGIARAFLGQWLGMDETGTVVGDGLQPDIITTGLHDAGPVAAGVFRDGDAAGWAGTLMFGALGAPEFYENLIIRSLDGPDIIGLFEGDSGILITADGGSYNAIAAAAVLQEFQARQMHPNSLNELFENLRTAWQTLHLGDTGTVEDLATLKFAELYGLDPTRNEPRPDIGNDTFGVINSIVFDWFKDAHYTIGSSGNDRIGYSPAGNGSFATATDWWQRLFSNAGLDKAGDVINAGRGDDIVYGTTGSDILDGGPGYDELTYLPGSWSTWDTISLAFDSYGKFGSRATIEKWSLSMVLTGRDKDVAVDFDKITFDYRAKQVDDPESPSGRREDAPDRPDAPYVEVLLPQGGSGQDGELVRNETVKIFGNIAETRGALVSIDLGKSEVGFHQDEVDASAATVGIYFNLGTGSLVGLDQASDISGSFNWLGVLASVQLSWSDLRVKNANSVIGTPYSDILIASSGDQNSGEGYSALYGMDGNDLLLARGWESHLYGGEGDDQFDVGSNAWVEDADTNDIVTWAGFRIYGGSKQSWMEGNTAYWAPFNSVLEAFPVIGRSILTTAAFFIDAITMKFAQFERDVDGNLNVYLGWGHGGMTVIKDYNLDLDSGLGSGGITVFERERAENSSFSNLAQYLNLALKSGFGIGFGSFDPLVLDLDGDGLELTSEGNSRVYFEFDSDGFGERTGWVRSDDGLLAHDVNGNGLIDDVTELFGNQTTSGFAMLGAHDLNSDGVIDASDAVFSELRIWRDLDQDGVTDAGELKTLAESGITSISLANSAPAEPTAIGGNEVVRTGSFTRADGTTGTIADIAFQINDAATRWLGDDTISANADALPQLRGYGTVKDLRVAMTGDATLEGLVAAFAAATTNNIDVMKADSEAILYRWAGVEGVAADPIGTGGMDMRKLAFLEKYGGYTLMPRDTNGDVLTTNLSEVEALWADQVARLTLRLALQGPLAAELGGITYREDIDLLVAETPTALGDLYARLLEDLPSDPVAALAQWESWGPLLGAMADGMRRFDNNLVRGDYIAAQLLAAMDSVAQPLDFATLAAAIGAGELRVASTAGETLARGGAGGTISYVSNGGSDTLTGGSGQDVYIFGRQIGDVTIGDEEAAPAGDRIRFAFLTPEDVTLERDGNDLLITVTATGETIRVLGQFAAVVPLASDILLSSNKGVEEIQFADGTIYEIPEIMTAVGTGSDGDDHMAGTMHSDVLIGGLGNDRLEGGDDADLYVIHAGDGHDVIHDVQSTVLLRAADLLIFGEGIAPGDLVFSRAGATGEDLVITIGASGQSVTIEDQFAYLSLGFNDRLAPNSRIEAFAFRNYGESWSNRDIQQRLIAQETTAGADETQGFGDDDEFGASAGNDLLIGYDGADRYHFGRGSGHDVIDENALYIDVKVGLGGLSLTERADTVVLDNLVSSDILFSRSSEAPDLLITILATGETLLVKNQFAGFQTGPFGAQWLDRIEWFEFADGSRVSWQDVLADVTTGGVGDDNLWGDLYADRLQGSAGNDFLSGRGYGDTYVFGLGDGHDTIFDDNQNVLGEGFVTIDSAPDILEFGAGIGPEDISFIRNGSDLTLVVGSGGDRVTLKGQDSYIHTGVFGAVSYNRIEEVRFADGTAWTWQQLNQRVIDSGTTAGADDISGSMMADLFEASAGNDVLRGGDSGDTYRFGIGSGHDTIRESVSNVLHGDEDVVEFGAGITEADVSVSRSGNDLILTLASGDTLTVAGEFAHENWFEWTDVELFRFSDGTVWTKGDVQARLLESTAGNDHLVGFLTNDVLDGGAGNDILEGRDGSDTYVLGVGSGNDIVRESVSNANLPDDDRVLFAAGVAPGDVALAREGDDLLLTLTSGDTLRIEGHFSFSNWFAWSDVERFEFADGTVWSDRDVAQKILGGTAGADHLVGTFRSDTLDGGAGNDLLEGGDGADRYMFGRGYGQDEIREGVSNANLAEDDQLQFSPGVSLADLGFARHGNDLLITIVGTDDSLLIKDQFRYQNWFTWWDVDQFLFADGTALSAGDVQQLILTGTPGNDHLVGFMTGDTLKGGAGNDILEGGDGADTYVFGRGFGQDEIRESVGNANLSENDTLRFTADVSWEDLTFARNGSALSIGIAGTSDTVTIVGQWQTINDSSSQTWWDVENFVFADGTQKTVADVRAALMAGTDGADHIVGFFTDDRIEGGKGDDLLEGGRGADTYVHNVGDGHDRIGDSVGSWASGNDRLLFGTDILPANVVIGRSSANAGDMLVSVNGGDSSVTLAHQIDGGWEWQIDFIEFADGTLWNADDIAGRFISSQVSQGDDTIGGTWRADTISGLGGNDLLQGAEGNDRLDGGVGNDRLEGQGGDDTYVYTPGSGDDVISDYAYFWGSWNILEFGAGIAASDLRFSISAADESDMVIRFAAASGSVTIDNQLFSGREWGIDEVRFADGQVWSIETLLTKYAARQGTAASESVGGTNAGETLNGHGGDDIVKGFAGNDILIGGTGNDLLMGGSGDDVYRFGIGDGQDVIDETALLGSGGGLDTVEFGAGINPGDVAVTNVAGQDLVFSIAGSSDTLTLKGTVSNPAQRIETIRFADGTVWFHADLVAQTPITGTSGDDVLYGTNGDDRFELGLGNDMIRSGAGADTYVYRLGDGNDIIDDESGSRSEADTLRLYDLNPADIMLTRNGVHSVLTVTSTGHTITFDEQFWNADYWGIDQILFANGTLWDRTRIQAESAIRGTAGNDTLYGTNGNDTFDAGPGNDLIRSGPGADTYLYRSGDGSDTIDDESGSRTEVDVLKLLDLNPNDVTFSRNGVHGIITVNATGEALTLDEQFWNSDHWGIDALHFANGEIWDRARIQLEFLTVVGTSGSDTISGTNDTDHLDGAAGNDTLYGGGASDTLIGGLGNDRLEGGAQSDTYHYAIGDGADHLLDADNDGSAADVLVLGAGIAPETVILSRSTVHHLSMNITFQGLPGSIYVDHQWWNQAGLEQIRFADGTAWNHAQIATRYIADQRSEAADTIGGTGFDDVIDGLGGNDTIYGGEGADVITGGAGDDRLEGEAHSDTYHYAIGDGADYLLDRGNDNAATDILIFGSGITASNIVFARSSIHHLSMNISFEGFAGSIYVDHQWWGEAGLEQIRFADGTVMNQAQIAVRYVADQQTAGADTIGGTAFADIIFGLGGNDLILAGDGEDVITGGDGNDRLEGEANSDTYHYALGDGDDYLLDRGSDSSAMDTLVFGAGISASDLIFSSSPIHHLSMMITFANHTGSIYVDHQLWNQAGLERIRFADGSVMTEAEFTSLIDAGSQSAISGGAAMQSPTMLQALAEAYSDARTSQIHDADAAHAKDGYMHARWPNGEDATLWHGPEIQWIGRWLTPDEGISISDFGSSDRRSVGDSGDVAIPMSPGALHVEQRNPWSYIAVATDDDGVAGLANWTSGALILPTAEFLL